MSVINRRNVLKIAGGLLAFVPAAKALAQETSHGSIFESNDPPPSPEQIESYQKIIAAKYAEGDATKVTAESIEIREASGNLLLLTLAPESKIWKGGWNAEAYESIMEGDRIIAWGNRDKSSLSVEQVYSNIENIVGKASGAGRFERGEVNLVLNNPYNGSRSETINIDSKTEIIADMEPEKPNTVTVESLNVEAGQFLQVVGLRLKDGSIKATRLFLQLT